MARCALELCLDEGCWLDRVRLRDTLELVLQRVAGGAGLSRPPTSSDDRAA